MGPDAFEIGGTTGTDALECRRGVDSTSSRDDIDYRDRGRSARAY